MAGPGTGNNPASDYIKSILGEGAKTHAVYDGSNRLSEFYEAPASTADGGRCMVTFYTYILTSGRVENTKETVGAWDSAWDIP